MMILKKRKKKKKKKQKKEKETRLPFMIFILSTIQQPSMRKLN